MIQELCLTLLKVTAIYFVCIKLLYGLMVFLSWMKIKRFHLQHKENVPVELPAVSFIIPAFNEESLIVETIQTYLSLPHQRKEIIVVNDGSNDQTFRMLQTMFQLRRVSEGATKFRSITCPELYVVESPHLGKAQALNFGVRHAQYEIICTMDADTIPTARGVEGCLRAFLEDPKLMACGGIIQVLHSQVLKENSPVGIQSAGLITSFQRLEYLRTFLCERLGWSLLGSTTLISGAFCMVKKEALAKVNGFRHNSITEDLDLIIRLRRAYPGQNYHFKILPITTCYTQVPRDTKHLMVQRIRWQLGLVDTLACNLKLLFRPTYGILGMFTIPYMWAVEVFSPLLALTAWVLVPFGLIQGWIAPEHVAFYLGVGFLFNVALTLFGASMDEKYVSRAQNWSWTKCIRHTFLMHFGYKQLTSWWRFLALLKIFRKKYHWGEKPRQEIIHQNL